MTRNATLHESDNGLNGRIFPSNAESWRPGYVSARILQVRSQRGTSAKRLKAVYMRCTLKFVWISGDSRPPLALPETFQILGKIRDVVPFPL